MPQMAILEFLVFVDLLPVNDLDWPYREASRKTPHEFYFDPIVVPLLAGFFTGEAPVRVAGCRRCVPVARRQRHLFTTGGKQSRESQTDGRGNEQPIAISS